MIEGVIVLPSVIRLFGKKFYLLPKISKYVYKLAFDLGSLFNTLILR